MNHKYGHYSPTQMKNYKKDLHSKIHWMLLYKDPHNAERYKNINVNKYVETIQFELNGLNELLFCPSKLVTLMSLIESVRLELLKKDFSFEKYRKTLLDAHSLIDKLPEMDGE